MTSSRGVRQRSSWQRVLLVIAVVASIACEGSKNGKASPATPSPNPVESAAAARDAATPSIDAATPPASWSEVPDLADAIALAPTSEKVCAVRRSGSIVCWADIASADGEQSAPLRPTPLAPLGPAVAIGGESSGDYLCAVRKSGAVHCRTVGQPEAKPVRVAGVRDAIAVAAHIELACALGRKGAVRCWKAGEEKTRAATIKGLPPLVSMQMFGLETAGIDRKGGLWRWDSYGGERIEVSRRACEPGPAYLAEDRRSYKCKEAKPAPVDGVRGLVLQGGAETMDLFHALLVGDSGFYAYSDKAWGDKRPILKATGGAPILSFIEPFALPADTERILAASPIGCAVTRAGPVHCWGGEPFGHTPKPTLMPPPTAIASDGYQLCALSVAGNVSCMSL